jgi:hypothetical protein
VTFAVSTVRDSPGPRAAAGGRRLWAACLVGVVWALVALAALQELNLYARWWDFRVEGGVMRDMPVELWLGWAVLWGGAIPVLVFASSGFSGSSRPFSHWTSSSCPRAALS